MASRLHQSGLVAEANYVAPYPGHRIDSPKMLLTNALRIVAGSLGGKYLDDLIIRHTTAAKSQNLRREGKAPTAENQLSTICLRPDPVRTGALAKRYVKPPLGPGKTVLVVDDICTQGYSFEAARLFIESTGATAIGVSWLKTPGNDYQSIVRAVPKLDEPYKPYGPEKVLTTPVGMAHYINNAKAPAQIADAFSRYSSWKW